MAVWSVYEAGPGSSCGIRVLATLVSVTDDSKVSVLETGDFGRILSLGEDILLSDRKEDPYHEMLALMPLACSPKVTSALLAGGSDGATLEMLLRHPGMERVTIVGSDRSVMEAITTWFPAQAQALDDPRVRIEKREAAAYVRDSRERFDLIIVDAPGASNSPLFPQSFYCDSFRLLTSDGAVVVDCGSYADQRSRRELASAVSRLKRLFPVFRLYEVPGILPIFARHLFAMATKTFDPTVAEPSKQVLKSFGDTFHFNAEIMRSCFALPESLRRLVEGL